MSKEDKVIWGIWLAILLTGCTYIYPKMGVKPDNVVEELVEEVIEAKTGLDIDLTPETEEE
jgi:hypothetical protein